MVVSIERQLVARDDRGCRGQLHTFCVEARYIPGSTLVKIGLIPPTCFSKPNGPRVANFMYVPVPDAGFEAGPWCFGHEIKILPPAAVQACLSEGSGGNSSSIAADEVGGVLPAATWPDPHV